MFLFSLLDDKVENSTDKHGRFQVKGGTLLASRYRVLEIVSTRGQSATLIKAQVLHFFFNYMIFLTNGNKNHLII